MATKKPSSSSASKPTKPATAKAESAKNWQPTAEAKGKATQLRIIAFILWLVAIGLEAFTIFWVLPRPALGDAATPDGSASTIFMVVLIGAIVVIGVIALIGSLMWKKAGRLDPPSEANKVTFFLKTQLGVIMTLIAFVPLIILIFLNKGMSKNQKTLAGIVGIVVLLLVGVGSADLAPVSSEDMGNQTDSAISAIGSDSVYWVPGGNVYHYCSDYNGKIIPAFSRSDVTTITNGTVAEAVAANKKRPSMYAYSECGLTEGSVAELPTDQPS
ncbi:MAG: hypothetical protein LBN10_10155 [Propionibacteriaceae bacterium]|nr:hypothetical protein [Propionibacteriaceae bacterium]